MVRLNPGSELLFGDLDFSSHSPSGLLEFLKPVLLDLSQNGEAERGQG